MNLKGLAAGVMMTASVLLPQASLAQQKIEKVKQDTAPDIENVLQEKMPSHAEIIKMDADSVIQKYGINVLREHLLIEINKLRTDVGVNPLKKEGKIDTCAQKFAYAIGEAAKKNLQYAHEAYANAELAGGRTPDMRFRNSKFNGKYTGEINISGESIEMFLVGLKRSPEHYKCLLDSVHDFCGMGYISWVKPFGKDDTVKEGRNIIVFGSKWSSDVEKKFFQQIYKKK